jgi:hypothetical protein
MSVIYDNPELGLGGSKFEWISFFFWTLVKAVQDLSLAANALGNEGMPLAVGLMNWSPAPPWMQGYAWTNLSIFCSSLTNLWVSNALVQVILNECPFSFWVLIKAVQDLGLGTGLCLNHFLFLFISHKLVSEQGLGASKFEWISCLFLDFGQGSARPQLGLQCPW